MFRNLLRISSRPGRTEPGFRSQIKVYGSEVIQNASTRLPGDSQWSLLIIPYTFGGISWQIVDFPGETQFRVFNEHKVSRFWTGMSQIQWSLIWIISRTLLRTQLVHGTVLKRMGCIKKHQNTRITEERRRSAQVSERDVVHLELGNSCLDAPNGHYYRFVVTIREVTSRPMHRFTIELRSLEMRVTQRRDISAPNKSTWFHRNLTKWHRKWSWSLDFCCVVTFSDSLRWLMNRFGIVLRISEMERAQRRDMNLTVLIQVWIRLRFKSVTDPWVRPGLL